MLALKVSVWVDDFREVVVFKFACLFEAIHDSSDFRIDVPIVFQHSQSVLLNSLLWDHIDWYAQIFI